MKWLLVLSSVLVAFSNAQDTCYDESVQGCNNSPVSDELKNCNAIFSGFPRNVGILQRYANHQIEKSFEYLLLATNFGSYVKNRPGFEKQFRSLSDKSWNYGIELIKHITKRGGAHDFSVSSSNKTEKKQILDLNEINALALTLDYEKILSTEAHHIHEKYSHAKHPTEYDPEVAHFIEEEFIEGQASTIRKLSGYTNDLKKLFKDTSDISLSLYLFDEYLGKQ
jgi:ferritin heavy chain